jgi:teichuronic acid biosynthesis glycosyltransferase TuaG
MLRKPMDKKPSVSVITPAYNAARFIRETIKSVQAQTFTDWEMIVIDDCSTDDTKDVVEEEAIKDPRIRLIRMDKNSGQARARNRGIREARGKYMAFLDSDDLWLPEKLALQTEFMEQNGCALTYTSYKKINENGDAISNPLKFPPVVNLDSLLKSNYIGCLTAVYNAEKMGKVYMPNIAKREDYALWLKILSMGYKAYLVDRCLAMYRVRAGSVSNNKASAAFYQWKVYREVEKLSLIKSLEYFFSYALNGAMKFWGLRESRTEAAK